MLVLSRKNGEGIKIGNSIAIAVHEVEGDRVSLVLRMRDEWHVDWEGFFEIPETDVLQITEDVSVQNCGTRRIFSSDLPVCKLGIKAPSDVLILRQELVNALRNKRRPQTY